MGELNCGVGLVKITAAPSDCRTGFWDAGQAVPPAAPLTFNNDIPLSPPWNLPLGFLKREI